MVQISNPLRIYESNLSVFIRKFVSHSLSVPLENMLKRTLFFFLPLLFFVNLSFARQDRIPDLPSPPRLVNNLSQKIPDFISASQTQALENKLVQFSDSTSNQIAIVIVDTLNGYAPYEYASLIGKKWGIGQKEHSNGIVILIDPVSHNIFIAAGSGLQGAIPDATAKQVIENEIKPEFKKGNYYAGLDNATTVLMQLAKGEYDSDAYAKQKGISPDAIVYIVVILIFIFVLTRKRSFSIGSRGTYWGGGYGGFSSGGGFSGGGGSFGGFGGGSFNGGGAGGSW